MKGKGCDLKQRLADLPDSGQREVCAQSRAFDAWDAQGTGWIERTTDTCETERTHFRLRVTSLVRCFPRSRETLQPKKYDDLGHAVDRSVHGVQNHFSVAPLFDHNNWYNFRSRSPRTMIPLTKKISPSFQDGQPLKACIIKFLRAREQSVS
jgi:hypothetical protein